MAHYKNNSMEKVTFNMPTELKKQVMELKEELQVSLSAIYNEAIVNYLKHKEIEMWQRGVSMALEDEEYMEQAKELGSDTGDWYEYQAK